MLYYKGRMDMDHMEVVDVEDGKERDFNITVKNALKLRSRSGDEVHLLCAKKPEHKQRWLRAFADERIQVLHDRETGQPELRSIFKKRALLLFRSLSQLSARRLCLCLTCLRVCVFVCFPCTFKGEVMQHHKLFLQHDLFISFLLSPGIL